MSRPLWILGFFLGVTALQASGINFDFNLTATDSNGDPVSATAVFTIVDAHHFTITITDTTSMLSLQQIVQGIEFDMQGSGIELIDSSGDFIVVNGNGTATDLPSGGTGWGMEGSSSSLILCAQCGTNGDGLVGSGPYSSALAGTYLDGSVTFEFFSNSALSMDGSDPFWNVSLYGFTNSTNPNLNGGGGSTGPGTGDGGTPSGNPNTPAGNNNSDPPGNNNPGPTQPNPNGSNPNPNNNQAAVPEPESLLLSAVAIAVIAAAKRRKAA